VDVTNLEIGKFIKASQLTMPNGARIVYAQDYNVLTVAGKIAAVAAPAAEAAKPAAKGKK
jgi:hypothetical protein